MRSPLIGFFGLILFISCQDSARESKSYFDSLVVAQEEHLSAAKARVTKFARIDRTEGQTTFVPDVQAWENELSVFRQLGVFEKPAYQDAYEIRDQVHDAKSNLLIRSYIATRNVPVTELKFYYHERLGNLKRIEAFYQEKNPIYSTHRTLSMEFDDVKGLPLLSSYLIQGSQKMVLSDSVQFSVKSILSF